MTGSRVRAALAVAALAAVLLPAARAGEPRDLLPDLVQRAPYKLGLEQAGERWRLVFASAVENHGEGPLLVEGSRRNRATPEMRADQVVLRSDGSTRVV